VIDIPVPALIAVGATLGLGNSAFMLFSRNAALKRRLFPVTLVVGAVLFLVIVHRMFGRVPPIMWVAIAVIMTFTAVTVRFCDACGMPGQRLPFGPPPKCMRCGAAIDGPPAR